MATGKLNYWLKLRRDFLFSDAVGFLMSLPNSGKYVVFYWQLCALAINTGGELLVKIGKIKVPYDIEKIRQECKYYSAEEVEEALKYLEDLGLISCQRNGTYKIVDFDKMVGSETDYAVQKREQRKKKNANQSDADRPADSEVDGSADRPVDNVHTDIRDKILDIRYLDIKNLDISISGGDDARASAKAIREYFGSRSLDPMLYFGTTDDLLAEVNSITKAIFANLGGRTPTPADGSAVFTAITKHKPDETTGEIERFIPKDALDLLLYAFEQAVYAGKPGNWNYINGVLARLSQRGITTLADAEAYDDERYR